MKQLGLIDNTNLIIHGGDVLTMMDPTFCRFMKTQIANWTVTNLMRQQLRTYTIYLRSPQKYQKKSIEPTFKIYLTFENDSWQCWSNALKYACLLPKGVSIFVVTIFMQSKQKYWISRERVRERCFFRVIQTCFRCLFCVPIACFISFFRVSFRV